MATVEEFLLALDSIEAEIRHSSDVIFIELSLTREEQNEGDVSDYVDRHGRHFILLMKTWIDVHWESMCLDFSGSTFPFVWLPERSEVQDSLPENSGKDLGVGTLRVWYYLDSQRNPIPKKFLDRFPLDENNPYDDEDTRAAMLYNSDMERVLNIMNSMRKAWSMAPESVLREFGDLSMLLSNPDDPDYAEEDVELWWPLALLILAIRKSDVVLSAKFEPYIPWETVFDDLPPEADHQARLDEFNPTTWTVSLSVPSVIAATRCAIRAFRRVAEEDVRSPMDLHIKVEDAAMATPKPASDPSETPPPSMPKPYWNRFKGELSFDGEVVKTIRSIGIAKNIVQVLDAFQASDWPDRVESPLPACGQQHHATINSLNTRLSRIRFQSDGEGKGFIWKAL